MFFFYQVQVRDRNFIQCMHSLISIDTFSENDTMIQMSRCSFDIHVQEILGSLLFGATLVMLRPHGIVDFDYVSVVLERKQITYIHTVPRLLLDFFTYVQNNSKQTRARHLRSVNSIGKLQSYIYLSTYPLFHCH